MKTTLAFSVIALLCTTTLTIQANTQIMSIPILDDSAHISIAKMIGTGIVRSKNGNNYTILGDDENTYQAVSQETYVVGAYVSFSDPVHGFVEILGLAHQ